MRSVFYPNLVNGPFGDPAVYVRLAHRGEALQFDCGDLSALTTRELLKIDTVFISHAHIDHTVGFDPLLRAFLYTDRTLTLIGPPGFARQVEARLGGYTWNLVEGFPFTLVVHEWREDGAGASASFRAGNRFRAEAIDRPKLDPQLCRATPDWTVRPVALDHGDIVSLGYALEETLHVAIHKDSLDERGFATGPWLAEFKRLVQRGADDETPVAVPLLDGTVKSLELGELKRTIAHCEAGMKVVYITDVSPTAANRAKIVALARDAHLLIIEAVFSHAEFERARQRHHLTARIAGEIAREAGVARLKVFHHSPRYLDRPGLLRDEAMGVFEG